MSKTSFHETVKYGSCTLSLTATLKGVQIPVNLGQNEVIILLGLDYSVVGNCAVGTSNIEVGLYRKSEKLPDTIFGSNDSDIIWSRCHRYYYVSGNVPEDWTDMIHFPYPVVLIRSPQVCGIADVFDSGFLQLRVYYLIERVSDKELTELMVKDHA